MNLARVAIAAGLLTIAACNSLPIDPNGRLDARACEQTYEFGNSGCAEIEGAVLDRQDRALPGMIVGPRYVFPGAAFNTPYATTDSAGRFRLRITRFGADAPAVGPDTVSLFVLAYDPRSSGLNVPATVRDSVMARVTVAPLGRVPVPASVTIRLPVN
jgi:hypothetical protein